MLRKPHLLFFFQINFLVWIQRNELLVTVSCRCIFILCPCLSPCLPSLSAYVFLFHILPLLLLCLSFPPSLPVVLLPSPHPFSTAMSHTYKLKSRFCIWGKTCYSFWVWLLSFNMNDFQVHPFSCRCHNFILLHCSVKFCVYEPHFFNLLRWMDS